MEKISVTPSLSIRTLILIVRYINSFFFQWDNKLLDYFFFYHYLFKQFITGTYPILETENAIFNLIINKINPEYFQCRVSALNASRPLIIRTNTWDHFSTCFNPCVAFTLPIIEFFSLKKIIIFRSFRTSEATNRSRNNKYLVVGMQL